MAKKPYLDNDKMYKLLQDLREYSDYDPEVFMLRKKNFKGLKFDDNGKPILSTIMDDPKTVFKTKPDGTVVIVEKPNAKTAEEKRKIAKEILAKDKEYKAKCKKLLESESESDTILRRKKAVAIKNKLGAKFLLICNNMMKMGNFTNYTEDRQGDMISDATWVMIRYMNRYDLTKTNPFAYFTTVCRNAFIHQITESKKHSKRFKSITFMENINEDYTGDFNDYDYE